MMNLDSSIFYFGFWEVNYEHLGCFLPVKAVFWARESSKMCVFWPRKVGNVTVQICNISRMAWRNAMIFWGGGNWHYIFDFRWFLSQTRWWFWMKSQKTMFLRFFQFSAKTTIFYQKRFKDLIFHHQNKLWFKCSKKWSGSSVTMLPWSLCLAQKLKSPNFGQIRCISNCVWNIDKYVGNVLEKRDRSLG